MLKSNLISAIHSKYPSLNPAEIESISNLFFKKITLALNEGTYDRQERTMISLCVVRESLSIGLVS